LIISDGSFLTGGSILTTLLSLGFLPLKPHFLFFSYELLSNVRVSSYEFLNFRSPKTLCHILHMNIYKAFPLCVFLNESSAYSPSRKLNYKSYTWMVYFPSQNLPFIIMSAKMVLKMTLSCKRFTTGRIITFVRSFSCVNTQMSLEVTFLCKRLITTFISTLKRSFTSLCLELKEHVFVYG
jgi:hypothetical protein